MNASIESAAKAAIAAAVEDVTIRPLAPKPSLFIDPAASEPDIRKPELLEPAAFIPPQPERMPARAPRMPRIDELPVPAQNEIRARRGEIAARTIIPKSAGCRCCSGWPRSVSAAASQEEQERRRAALPPAPWRPVSAPCPPSG